jgi:hypothetical protein
MKFLIACECSGIARGAFESAGHTTWSCDLLSSWDGSPFHIQNDVRNIIPEHCGIRWDAMIAFPPFADSLVTRYSTNISKVRRQAELEFCMSLMVERIPRIAIVGDSRSLLSKVWRPPDQSFAVWKAGCEKPSSVAIWLKGFPCLYVPDSLGGAPAGEPKFARFSSSRERFSITHPGLARIMAAQWV